MKKNLLIEILISLQKKEIKAIRKFLQSPFFNQREDVILLFEYLIKAIHHKEDDVLHKETVFKAVFPKLPFSDKKLRYTMSFLLGHIRTFLSYQEFKAASTDEQIYLLKHLKKRNLVHSYEQHLQKTKGVIAQNPVQNIDFQFDNFQLHSINFLAQAQQKRVSTESFAESSHYLTVFYMVHQLKLACYGAVFQTMSGKELVPDLLPQILETIKAPMYQQIPTLAVYHLCYRALTAENSSALFAQLRQKVGTYQALFPLTEMREIFGYMLNYFIRKINEGGETFKRDTFEVYQEGLKLSVFIENGQLSRFHYKNIVASGLGLQEYAWVRQFIEAYKEKLEAKYRESAYAFNLALLYYKQNDYPQAMTLLQRVGTDDVLTNLNARRMLLRIYYDLGEYDALESLLDSFRNYIYRRRDLGYQKALYLNLIRFTRQLLSLENYDKVARNQLRQAIEQESRLAERAWLLEKLN